MDDSERVDTGNIDQYIYILNDLVNKKKELGLDAIIEVEMVSQLSDLNEKRIYIDIIGSLPNLYHKQVKKFKKYIASLHLPKQLLNIDLKINHNITNKFPDFPQVVDVRTGNVLPFDIYPDKVNILCYYNVLKNNVDGNSYPYVSESMKYLCNLQKVLERNEGLRKMVRVVSFTHNREDVEFINKYIHKKKLKYMEHYFIAEYMLIDQNDLSLGSNPLIILVDKERVIRYFGNPLYTDLEGNVENLYNNGYLLSKEYREDEKLQLGRVEQQEAIDKLAKYYNDVLKNQMQCFSSFTLHYRKVINEPFANLDDFRCTLIAEVDNLTHPNKVYVNRLVELVKNLNPKIDIDLNNIYSDIMDEDRTCCFCQ
jgi:hypothetical protein